MNFLLTIYGLETVFPWLNTVFNSFVVCTACLFGWLLLSIFADRDYYLYQDIKNMYPLLFLAFTVLIPYAYGVGVIGNRYLSLALIPFGYIIFNYYKDKKRLRDLKYIFIIISLFASVTLIKTLKALIESPYISRSIKSSGEYSQELARQGIGGYGFIYFIVIASVFLLYIALKSTSRLIRFITAVGYILSLYFVLMSNYMTALLTVFLASLVLILSHSARSGSAKVIIIAFLIILLFINMEVIINRFADFIPKRIAKILITENGDSVYRAILDEFINDRWPTMLTSIETLFKYPFFGVISSDGISVTKNGFLTGFGQHSHILDTFALYGAVIGIANLFIIFKPFKDKYGCRIKYGRALNNAMWVCIICIYLFNNATPSIALAFGIIFPLLREIYDSGAEI